MLPIGQIVLVLHADDVDDLARTVDLVRLYFAQSHMPDLALLLQLYDWGQRLLHRDLRVDAMQLPEGDRIGAQPSQAHLYLLLQILRPGDNCPSIRSLAGEAALGGDRQAFGKWRQGLANQALADRRTVGVGGVDEVHAQFHGALQDPFCLVAVFRFAPDALAGQPHRPKSQAAHFQVAADLECLCHCHAFFSFSGLRQQ